MRAVALTHAPARTLTDGEQVRAGDRVLQVIHTPGHAPDHVCFWDAAARELYSGDMVLLHTSALIGRARRQCPCVPGIARANGGAWRTPPLSGPTGRRHR